MATRSKEKPKTALQEVYWKFWDGFNTFTQNDSSFCREFKVHPFPSVRSYQDYSIGEPYAIVVGINFKRHEIRVGAYFRDVEAYLFYSEMLKGRIERKVGKSLKWTCHQTKASAYLYDEEEFDESNGWEKAYRTIVYAMCLMKAAFEFGRYNFNDI